MDRYLASSGRGWVRKSRFLPLANIEDSFRALDSLSNEYRVTRSKGVFLAEVHVGDRVGKAAGQTLARTVSLALAQAIGLEFGRERNEGGEDGN